MKTVYLMTNKKTGVQYAMGKNELWFMRGRTASGRGWRKWKMMEHAVGYVARDYFLAIGADMASDVHTASVKLPKEAF